MTGDLLTLPMWLAGILYEDLLTAHADSFKACHLEFPPDFGTVGKDNLPHSMLWSCLPALKVR